VVSLKLVFSFTQRVKCLGKVNLDSMKQALRSSRVPVPSQSQPVRVRVRVRVPVPVPVPVPVSVFWQKGRGRESTSSLQPHLALQATNGIMCQPNILRKPIQPTPCRTNTAKAASGNPPASVGDYVLYSTIGSGEKGICAEKAPHWKTGISWP
jgi:hypothetical protein